MKYAMNAHLGVFDGIGYSNSNLMEDEEDVKCCSRLHSFDVCIELKHSQDRVQKKEFAHIFHVLFRLNVIFAICNSVVTWLLNVTCLPFICTAVDFVVVVVVDKTRNDYGAVPFLKPIWKHLQHFRRHRHSASCQQQFANCSSRICSKDSSSRFSRYCI